MNVFTASILHLFFVDVFKVPVLTGATIYYFVAFEEGRQGGIIQAYSLFDIIGSPKFFKGWLSCLNSQNRTLTIVEFGVIFGRRVPTSIFTL